MTLGDSLKEIPCAKCGKQFRPRDPRHKTCYDCFQKSRGPQRETKSSVRPDNLNAEFSAYLKELRERGYFNDKGYLRSELVVEKAEMVAQKLVRAEVTMGQLRRFFTMARSLERRAQTAASFDELEPEIAGFHKFAASVVGRAQKKGGHGNIEALRDFIDENVTLARQNQKSFLKGFLPHFESVIAYFTLHSPN